MCVFQLAAVAGCVAQGGLQSELAAFVFTHGYKIELTVSTVWGQDEQDFSLTLSFESLPERDNFRSALASAREQWNNGASVASPALVSKALLGSGTPAASSAETTAGGEGGSSPSASSSSASSVVVGSVLRVVEAAKVRASPALDSEQVGMLLCNERVLVLEVVTLSSTVEYHPDDSGEDEEDENEAEADETDSDTEEGNNTGHLHIVSCSTYRQPFYATVSALLLTWRDLAAVLRAHRRRCGQQGCRRHARRLCIAVIVCASIEAGPLSAPLTAIFCWSRIRTWNRSQSWSSSPSSRCCPWLAAT